MESYGALLKRAREEKNLSIEEVERETSITAQYITALELEKSEVFPGEPYLVGFLKNYSEYLGLSSANLLALYHAKKIQESPVPEELLKKKKPKFLLPLIIILIVLLLAGTGVYLYFFVFKVPQKREERAQVLAENTKIHQYTFSEIPEYHRLYRGDQLLVPSKNGSGTIVLTVSDTLNALTLQTPAGSQIVTLSEERALDVDGDGRADVILYVGEVSQADAAFGAETRMTLKNPDEYDDDLTAEELGNIEVATTATASRQLVIHEDNRAYPFTVELNFRGPCYLRYQVQETNGARDERYYKNGETESLDPKNGVRLWMSNAYAVKIRVRAGTSAYDLEVGRAGQVTVEDIKWVRGGENRYSLVVQELD